jgi:hypothetical protein
MYVFIGTHALKVDHGAKSPEEAPFIKCFQSLRPDLPKAVFKRLQTDMRHQSLKRNLRIAWEAVGGVYVSHLQASRYCDCKISLQTLTSLESSLEAKRLSTVIMGRSKIIWGKSLCLPRIDPVM